MASRNACETGETWPGWAWCPTSERSREFFQRRIATWHYPKASGKDAAQAFRNALRRGIDEDARWLSHPSLAWMRGGEGAVLSPESQLKSACWILQHMSADEAQRIGSLEVSEPFCAWSAAGPELITPGRYDPLELGQRLSQADVSGLIAVPDAWCDSLLSEYSSAADEFSDVTFGAGADALDGLDLERRVALALHSLMRTQIAFSRLLPEAATWVACVTQVVVPLWSRNSGVFRSGSLTQVPGVVYIEVTELELLMLEALVHESAHLHFYRAELDSPFIGGAGSERFQSPLRTDARPLRGIFLAYHALIYMVAFYDLWAARGGRSFDRARAELAAKRDDAEATLLNASGLLTESGRAFFGYCQSLAESSRGVPAPMAESVRT